MKPKKNKMLIYGLLGLAGLLGIAAIVTAIIYSQLEDVTPQPIRADEVNPVCQENSIQAFRITDEGYVRIDQSRDRIGYDEEIMLTATFVAPRLENDPQTGEEIFFYKGFRFIFNTQDESTNERTVDMILDNETIYRVDGDNTRILRGVDDVEYTSEDQIEKGFIVKTMPDGRGLEYIIRFPYKVTTELFGNNDTVTIRVRRLETTSQGLGLLTEDEVTGCIQTYGLNNSTVLEPGQLCLEAGQQYTDPCADLPEEECNTPAPPCCEGLTQVNTCAVPNQNNECPTVDDNCYICLDIEIDDGECDTANGENICNSPNDCTIDDEPDEPEPPAEPEEPEPPVEPTDTSNFAVTKSGTACVERVSPNNVADFRITVTNRDDTREDIIQIKDKLPLGFIYQTGSSIINGTADEDDSFVEVKVTGNTQEIIWTPPHSWPVEAGGSFVIEFRAVAGESAITGDVQNEVLVTPLNTPVDATSLRTEYVLTVAQVCEVPDTAIIERSWMKLGAGVLVIILSIVFYNSSKSLQLASHLSDTKALRTGEDVVDEIKGVFIKAIDPRRYFEEKFKKKYDRRKEE